MDVPLFIRDFQIATFDYRSLDDVWLPTSCCFCTDLVAKGPEVMQKERPLEDRQADL